MWLTLSKNLISFGLGVGVARIKVVERSVRRRGFMVDPIMKSPRVSVIEGIVKKVK